MSGGDFMSRIEAAVCRLRRIEDRAFVVRDLKRVVARHGDIGAVDQLGLQAGDIDRIEGRKLHVTTALLQAMYGTGNRAELVKGLTATSGIDADLAKFMAGLRPVAVADPAPVAEAVVTNPPPWRREIDPDDAGHQELVAMLKRAVEAIGSNRQAADVFGWGLSTLGFLKAGNRPFSGAQAERLRSWADANPEQNSSAATPPGADDRGAAKVPPPAPVSPDTAATATDARPLSAVEVPDAAVAAAPAGCTTPAALPPTVSGDDLVALMRAKLISEIADVEARQVAAEMQWLEMARQASAMEQQIDAWRQRLPVLRQAVTALDALFA